MIKVIMLCGSLFLGQWGNAQKPKSGFKKEVTWLSVQEASSQLEKEKRPVIIDVYTDWCHYCKVMDKTTWSNPSISDYVSKYFYPIKFNAESREPVEWMGKQYEFKPAYKVHMLAAEWCGGNMIYPSTIILVPGEEPVIIPGVITVKELEPMLKYFGEQHYLTTEWKSFKQDFKNNWN